MGTDSKGRVLADLYESINSNRSINQLLIAHIDPCYGKLCAPYHGEHKREEFVQNAKATKRNPEEPKIALTPEEKFDPKNLVKNTDAWIPLFEDHESQKSVSPGSTSPKAVSPGSTSPKSVSPGSTSPKSVSPGSTPSKAVSAGSTPSKAVLPRSTSPRYVYNGSTPSKNVPVGSTPSKGDSHESEEDGHENKKSRCVIS
jgi:hypothetical protein